MIKAFSKLNIYYKCSVLSGLFLIVLSLALIPFYFINLMEIPLGFLLGGAFGITIYFITGLLENKRPEYYKWAIMISVFRFILLAILLFVVALCYYKLDIKIFNIFTVTGGYFICLIIFVLLFLKKKKGNVDGSI